MLTPTGDQSPTTDARQALLDSLGVELRREFGDAEKYRIEQERVWLDDLRQYKGIYTPEEISRMGKRSKAFIRLSRSKIKSLDARMQDMLFPAGTNKNWSLSVTPVPDIDLNALPPDMIEAIKQAQAQGKQGDMEAAVKKIAEDRMRGMEREIDDQLSERQGNYSAVARDILHSGHLYGTGILKGPMVDECVSQSWRYANGTFAMAEVNELRPAYMARPVWNIYPDPFATTLEECEFMWERHVMPKHDLRKLAKNKRFNGAAIMSYIREHPEGDMSTPKEHENELRILAADNKPVSPGRRYEILERWGTMDGMRIAAAGIEISEEDLNVEFQSQVWILGEIVIMAAMNRSARRRIPYKFYYYDKDESSIWGEGVASIMRTTQRLYNATIRMISDNAAITSGPQVEINEDMSAEDNRPDSLDPFRIWWRRGKGEDAKSPMIRVYQFDSRINELLRLADLWSSLIDETTTLPKFTYGDPQSKGVTDTVGGLSMLMGQANITLKDNIKSWDDGITIPFLTEIYDWNMQWNDKPEIKGDYRVQALGSSSLIAKEIRAKALDGFRATTANAVDAPFTKRDGLLRESAKALDLPVDEIVKTKDEIEQENQQGQVLQQMQELLGEIAGQMGLTVEQLIDAVESGQQLTSGPEPTPEKVMM